MAMFKNKLQQVGSSCHSRSYIRDHIRVFRGFPKPHLIFEGIASIQKLEQKTAKRRPDTYPGLGHHSKVAQHLDICHVTEIQPGGDIIMNQAVTDMQTPECIPWLHIDNDLVIRQDLQTVQEARHMGFLKVNKYQTIKITTENNKLPRNMTASFAARPPTTGPQRVLTDTRAWLLSNSSCKCASLIYINPRMGVVVTAMKVTVVSIMYFLPSFLDHKMTV